MSDFLCATGLCNVLLSKHRLCWKLLTECRAGSEQSPAQCRGVGALTHQGGLWMQVEMKLEVAHSGSVILSTAFQEAQGHSIMILKVSSIPKDSKIAHSSPLVWSQKGFTKSSCLQSLFQSISAPCLSHILPLGLVQQHTPA